MSQRKLSFSETRGVLKSIPFNMLLGMRLTHLHRDGITLECRIVQRLLNSAGVLHGAVSAALADASAGVALHRQLGSHGPITTVEMKINYFRPVKKGRVVARARLIRMGSTICVGRVDISDSRDRAIATALVTYMILRTNPPVGS